VEAVVRHRHFTRAAEELHLAQSALSHQIRQLERELGMPLFERTSRRVAPTEAGLAVAVRARRVFAEVEGARQEVDELRGVQRGRIWIGPLHPAGDLDVPGLLARFSRAHPGVEVGLREGLAAEMIERVAADELDAAFCLLAAPPPDELAVEHVGREEVVVAFAPDQAPPGHDVDIAELTGPLIAPRHGSALTGVLEQRSADTGRTLTLALESGDPFLLRSLAARGFAAAMLPRSLTALEGPTIAVRSLRPVAYLPVVLLWRRTRISSPAARTFIAFVRRELSGPDV
jgi:LysR family transcriptional regulator, transcription activator of glutamate synthase operon